MADANGRVRNGLVPFVDDTDVESLRLRFGSRRADRPRFPVVARRGDHDGTAVDRPRDALGDPFLVCSAEIEAQQDDVGVRVVDGVLDPRCDPVGVAVALRSENPDVDEIDARCDADVLAVARLAGSREDARDVSAVTVLVAFPAARSLREVDPVDDGPSRSGWSSSIPVSRTATVIDSADRSSWFQSAEPRSDVDPAESASPVDSPSVGESVDPSVPTSTTGTATRATTGTTSATAVATTRRDRVESILGVT